MTKYYQLCLTMSSDECQSEIIIAKTFYEPGDTVGVRALLGGDGCLASEIQQVRSFLCVIFIVRKWKDGSIEQLILMIITQ